MTDKPTRSLYLCYFGVREPLVQNQVLPYLRELVKGGVEVSLLTFEPNTRWSGEEVRAQKEKLAAEGISWDFRKYHKRFSVLSTTYDILVGAAYARSHVALHGTDILHARVHMPAAMAVIAKKLSFGKRPKVLFDIRGFLPEEYTDAGIWKQGGLLYRSVKKVEAWILKNSDAFVVLTQRAQRILFPESVETGSDVQGRPVTVIPCCVDLERFSVPSVDDRRDARAKLGAEEKLMAAYVGSFGGWYLTDETMKFFRLLKVKTPDAFALIITKSPVEPILEALSAAGYPEGDRFVGPVDPKGVPGMLSAADFAVSFIKECYSKQASSPTKNAEYLASGLPMIVNKGIGDTAEHVTEDATGVVISDFSHASIESSIEGICKLIEDRAAVSERCRRSSAVRYSLESVGGEGYRKLYGRIAGDGQ